MTQDFESSTQPVRQYLSRLLLLLRRHLIHNTQQFTDVVSYRIYTVRSTVPVKYTAPDTGITSERDQFVLFDHCSQSGTAVQVPGTYQNMIDERVKELRYVEP